MNTVGSFLLLYIISCYSLRTNSEIINLSFSVTICKNDKCWGGWKSIMRTQAFERQQAQSVSHIFFLVQIFWEGTSMTMSKF